MPDPDRPSAVPWPPLLLVTVVGLGAVLRRLAPMPWPDGALGERLGWAGIALIVGGLGIELSVVMALRRAATTVMPHRGASALVTDGPFQRSRNPIYVAHVALVLGLGLLLGNGWWVALAPVFAVAIDRLAILREERHLEARFGDAYARYRASVRRWL